MDSGTREDTDAAAIDTLLLRLKRDTHASHTGLESHINLAGRILTVADYRKLLEAFYGLFFPIEARIEGHWPELAAWLPDIENRVRTEALRRDLHVLGNRSPHDIPIAAVPEYASLADQLGCLYVLEGSTLGGQVISRQIHDTLGLTPEHGCAFFYGYGAATGDRWRGFRQGIESYSCARPWEQAAVIQSALRTFRLFDAWMERCL